MKKIILPIVFLTVAVIAKAQTDKPDLVTDRPDQTEAPVLVPKGGLQVETGFVYEKDKNQNVEQANLTYNTTLIKYGINDHFELRFITEYLGTHTKVNESTTSKIKGFSPLALGVKIKLNEEKGFWPQAAFIGHINLKTGSQEYKPSNTAADFRFTFAHTLSEKLSLSYNVGAEWDGETPDAAFLYTLSLGYSISKRLAFFAEGYSFFPENSSADNRIDAGFTYKITPMLQWDISGGLGLSSNAPDSFISTGISFRVFK